MFVAVGILPLLLVVLIAIVGPIEPKFLGAENLVNVLRQSTFLIIVAMAQMMVLVTGNYDLSVGANIALSSVMINLVASALEPTWSSSAVVAASALTGVGVGMAIGIVNGIGVAVMKVHSFIMTLGTMSVALGLALMFSGGMPVSGVTSDFKDVFAYGRVANIPAPLLFAFAIFIALYLLMEWTRVGRHFYAVGSNIHAARLSGINTGRQLFIAHTLCGTVVGCAAVLLTARIGTGEAHMGDQFALASITACVLGGVSLAGGTGTIGRVVLGAFFMTMLTNGMVMLKVGGYAQILADGVLLILAVWIEQGRLRVAGRLRRG